MSDYPPGTRKRSARRIILTASLITCAIVVIYELIFLVFPGINFVLPQPYGFVALDALVNLLITFSAGLLVARLTRRIVPSIIVMCWTALCYTIISLAVGLGVGLVDVPPSSFSSYIPSFLQNSAIDLLAVISISLFGAWLGASLGCRSDQGIYTVYYGANRASRTRKLVAPEQSGDLQADSSQRQEELGTPVREFPALSVRQSVVSGLIVIVGSIALFSLLHFGLGVEGTAIFIIMVLCVIAAIAYIIRAVSAIGKSVELYTNGILILTPHASLPVLWHEIIQIDARKNQLLLVTGARIKLPTTIIGLDELHTDIATSMAQAAGTK
ncbi:hypothetical protein KDW_43840 [Dictyobacter vulcani]|uniref:Uncharacterized protein n=1 Tax=Dictyobacter vulcani TaxID=2607529 RepID=A0A5J4KSV3_9CHLR|nr:hypothetical protein [Dictyobacter vulcani]GER90222.1 hypothetical protein KDW_43840 [Dictyobacter vulcani]